MPQTIYYLIDKAEKKILQIGPLPQTWENISGLNEGMGEALSDLSWAGHVNKGFLTEPQALEVGISADDIDVCKNGLKDMVWQEVRQFRNNLISQIRWRVERHYDELALGLNVTENVVPILQYIQALRDITKQADPMNLVWPEIPA